MATLRPTSDGAVAVRPPEPGDAALIVAGRDVEFRRFMGAEATSDPQPTGCIVVGREVIGWVDWDVDREWLRPGQVNIGYHVFPEHRGRGYATRAVHLLLHHLAVDTPYLAATFLIHPDNRRSMALAERVGASRLPDLDGLPYFEKPVPPTVVSDGVVTLRRQQVDDVDDHLASIDDEQIDRLWLPGQREAWEAMTIDERRQHVLGVLQANHDEFGVGPKWCFAVDGPDAPYVAYVDADLANEHVPPGEANVSYSSHAAHRGRGYASRAVRLLLSWLAEHTAAREAHVGVDVENPASLRVVAAVGATERGRWTDDQGRTMIRHVLDL